MTRVKIYFHFLYRQSNFHALKVVGRGSETQHQVGEHFKKINWRVKGLENVATFSMI